MATGVKSTRNPMFCFDSRYGYRKELLELLTQLVRDMDRKIERQKDRAAKESEARVPTPPERSQLEEFKVSTCLDKRVAATSGLALVTRPAKEDWRRNSVFAALYSA